MPPFYKTSKLTHTFKSGARFTILPIPTFSIMNKLVTVPAETVEINTDDLPRCNKLYIYVDMMGVLCP